MRNIILLSILTINITLGQSSVIIQPNGNNGILSQNTTTVTTNPVSFTTPVSGAGTRLMWMPAKSALRVGTVDGTQWDASNIGVWSNAFGYSTTASSYASTSMGYGTTASGVYSTSMGYLTTASNDFSTSMGGNTTASGSYSTSMGGNTIASGLFSTSMGGGTIASGLFSTSMGNSTIASGDFSTSMGNGTTAQSYASLVLGRNNIVSGNTTSWVATDPLLVVGNGADNTNRNNALTLLKNGQLGIGTNLVATNELVQINGRMRLMRNTFASGLWLNNSTNGTAITDGAFIGLNNETAGSETAGFWLNGAFRWYVDRNGGTFQNSSTVSNLAGTGTRNVYADANGTLTTTSRTHILMLSSAKFAVNSQDASTYVTDLGNGTGATIYNNGGFGNSSFVHSLNLPNGAVVTNVTFYYNDTVSGNFEFTFSKDSFIDNSSFTSYINTNSINLTGANQNISTNVNVTIDETKIYNISARIIGTGGFGLDFRGVKVVYTL